MQHLIFLPNDFCKVLSFLLKQTIDGRLTSKLASVSETRSKYGKYEKLDMKQTEIHSKEEQNGLKVISK